VDAQHGGVEIPAQPKEERSANGRAPATPHNYQPTALPHYSQVADPPQGSF
jgi:hypothetical protein